jgi:N,N-dimethylformamidase
MQIFRLTIQLLRRLPIGIGAVFQAMVIGKRPQVRKFALGAEPINEAFLLVSAYGWSAGNNLSITLRCGADSVTFEVQSKRCPFQSVLGTPWTSLGDLISRVRSNPAAIRCLIRIVASALHYISASLYGEVFARAMFERPIRPVIYEVPVAMLHPNTLLSVEIRRRWGYAVVLGCVRLDCTSRSPHEVIVNDHPIEGYCNPMSLRPGDKVRFMVHSPNGPFSMNIARLGAPNRILYRQDTICGGSQNYRRHAYRDGAQWEARYELTIPDSWKAALYIAKVFDKTGNDFVIPLIVKRSMRQKPCRVVVLASTNTWNAYSEWGGASIYKYSWDDNLHIPGSSVVHSQRPILFIHPVTGQSHLLWYESDIYQWLDSHGYEYEVLTDADVHQEPDVLHDYRVVIINTHGEYWTKEMFAGLEDYLNRGGNVASLGGNGLYWTTVINEGRLVVGEPCGPLAMDLGAGGTWAMLGCSESRILGVRFTGSGTDSYAPYRVLAPEHWALRGTGLAAGDLIGAKGSRGQGASGIETDKLDWMSPPNVILLARGTNSFWGGAEMIYYDHPGGGGVFSVGSCAFGAALATDRHLSHIVRNVLDRFISDGTCLPVSTN